MMLKEVFTQLEEKTDKGTIHSYLDFYECLFRGMEPERLLEIGIYRGASLKLWKQYFGCKVVGVDYRTVSIPGIITLQGDAYSEDMVSRVMDYGPYDIIIEDGSHKNNDIQFFLQHYMKCLSPKGVLVIEDLTALGIGGLNKLLSKEDLERSYLVDRRHVIGQARDVLFVIDRR